MSHFPLSIGSVTIRREPSEALPLAFFRLACTALDEDVAFVAAFAARWTGREERFSSRGEGLFGAWVERGGRIDLAGIAGAMRDPYLDDPQVARLRHVYVAPEFRRQGVAEVLVRACLAEAQGHFRLMRLNAIAENAARLYERLGFRPVNDGQRATHVLAIAAE